MSSIGEFGQVLDKDSYVLTDLVQKIPHKFSNNYLITAIAEAVMIYLIHAVMQIRR
jgi:hypothetical protein